MRGQFRAFLAASASKGLGSSNPPRSATQSVLFHYNLEMAADPRVTRGFCARCEPEKLSRCGLYPFRGYFLYALKKRFASRLERILFIHRRSEIRALRL